MARQVKKKVQGVAGTNAALKASRDILAVFDERTGDREIREVMTDPKKGHMTGADVERGKDLLGQAEAALPESLLGKSAVPTMTKNVRDKQGALENTLGRVKVHVEGYLEEKELHAELGEFRKIFKAGSGQAGLPTVAATLLRAAGAPLGESESADPVAAEEAAAGAGSEAGGEGEAGADAAAEESIFARLTEAIGESGLTADDLAEVRRGRKELMEADQRQERSKGAKQEAVRSREEAAKSLVLWKNRWTKVARKCLTDAQLAKMGIKPRAKPTRKKKPATVTTEGATTEGTE